MSMREVMEQEVAEAIKAMNRANRALERLFGEQEGEGEDND